MPPLNVDQLHAWRMARHHLLDRAGPSELLDVVTDLGGLHAQVMSAGELIAGARVNGITPATIRETLWQERALVKTWAMRGTLHLLPAREYGFYVAAMRGKANYRNEAWRKYLGLQSQDEIDAIIEGVRVALDRQCLTREQLADAVAAQTGMPPHVREVMLSGWGPLLKPAAYHGYLCFGPSQGQAVTFVRPDQWLGTPWPEQDSKEALREVIRRFLATYGPATRDDFALWWGVRTPEIRATFDALGRELEPVEIEGKQAWALPGTRAQIERLDGPLPVRLLPMFDPFVFAPQSHRRHFFDEPYKDRIYRTAGWISATVIVDGRIAGVWEYEKGKTGLSVRADLFTPPTAATRAGIEAEAQRIADFFGLPLAGVTSTTNEETA